MNKFCRILLYHLYICAISYDLAWLPSRWLDAISRRELRVSNAFHDNDCTTGSRDNTRQTNFESGLKSSPRSKNNIFSFRSNYISNDVVNMNDI